MKNLIVAESAGFCFGVSRSVEMAEQLLAEVGECCSYGELIHNEDVISYLESKGMRVINSTDEISQGDNVLIRAHGLSRAICDGIKAAGAVIHDATCPRVKAIHKIVSNASEQGCFVIIIGMRNHPEVEAIRGWCTNCEVFENATELKEWLDGNPGICSESLTMVVQTTQTHGNFNECSDLIKKLCTNAKIFDTICNATFTRQNEASELSARCSAMVVIGGKHSANSVHLAQICAEHCDNVQFIERLSELDMSRLKDCDTVGLTAGASTPEWIIKEVGNQMSDEIKIEETAKELSFDEMLEDSLKPIYNGEKVTGIICAINGNEVSVDLGTKYSGFIPTEEFTAAGEKVEDLVKVGDEIEAIVVRVNDVEGTAQLSKKRLDAQKFWDDVENAVSEHTVLEGKVVEENKGGVVVNVNGIRVFVPASQSGLPKDAEMSQLLKQDVKLKITEANKARKRVVGSIRSALQDERKALREQIWNEIEIGKEYAGVVKSLTNYGAFVDIGGLDGMIHTTELTWGRIKHPSEVVNVGDEINVYVIGFDKDARRISLGYKDPNANPWKLFTEQFKVDDIASVKVVKLMDFGAFAEVLPGVDGLIHISQLADRRVDKVSDVVKVGDIVDAKITAIDEDKQKISLSIRALIEPEAVSEEETLEEASAEVEQTAEEFVEEVQTVAEEAEEKAETAVEAAEVKVEDAVEEVKETAKKTTRKAKAKVEETVEDAEVKAEEAVEEIKETAKKATRKAKAKVEETEVKVEETAEEVKETAKKTTRKAKAKVVEAVEEVKEAVEE